MSQLLEKLAGMTNGKALILGLLLGLAYYSTVYDDGSTLTKQMAVLDTELQTAEAKKKDTEVTLQEEVRMKEAVGKLSQQYAFIATKLPSELKSSEMIRGIDSVAKMAGVSVKMKKPGSVAKKEVVEELPVDVTLEGTYSQIAQFIYYTSNLERLTRVLNFTLVAPEDRRDAPLRFEGQVVSYMLAPEPEKAAAAAEEHGP